MNLFSQNLIKLQHIRQKNQDEEIQRKIQSDLEFLRELMARPFSEQSDHLFISRANSIPFKEQDFIMEDYVNKYFEELQQRNELMNLRKISSGKSLNRVQTSQSPDERRVEVKMQNRKKLRSTSLNQEKERMQLGEVFRLQEKIEQIMEENENKRNQLLNRVLSESDFYKIKKINFANYQFVKVKNPNPQMSDYMDKSTLMIDEMSSSYKYIYKLSKKFCNIDKEMTEKVSKKLKDEIKLKEEYANKKISQRVIGNPFSKKIRSESLLSQLINYKPADPVHRKLMLQKKLSDYNLKRRQDSFDNIQKQKLSRVNSEYILSTNVQSKINQSTNISSLKDSLYPQTNEKNDYILTEPDSNEDQQSQLKLSSKKRSVSTKSLLPHQETTPQKHFLQRLNSQTQQKFIVKSSSSQKSRDPSNNENILNSSSVKEFNHNEKQLIQKGHIQNNKTDKLKSTGQSFLQTVKNIDLSKSFQYNTLKSKNDIVTHPIEREQKLTSTTLKDSPLKLYSLFQNKNLRQKIQSQHQEGKPKYLNKQQSGEYHEIQQIPKYLQYKPKQSFSQSNKSPIQDQKQQTDIEENTDQVKLVIRKNIDDKTLLKIRNDNDFKALIIKIIVRENIDIKAVFERDYSLDIGNDELEESVKFFAKLVMKCESSYSTTELYQSLQQILGFKSENQERLDKRGFDNNDSQNEDTSLNIIKQLIVKYPASINTKLQESQFIEFLKQNKQLVSQLKESLYL